MTEREIIETFAAGFARSPHQRNGLFASDAEIVELDGRALAITVDDYSAEDRLSADDPALLGWNLVTATVSDLLAVGAAPRFLLNSLVTTPAMDAVYLRALAAGMQDALAACGATMAGGDIGTGEAWRFTGVAVGDFRAGQVPLGRVLPHGVSAGAVMVTGAFGDANLAAASGGPAPRFEMRLAESAALSGLAPAACIDTSDGLAIALETLCGLRADLRVEIDPSAVSYAPGVIDAAAAMRVPREVFLMGSAGEYELLALAPDAAIAAAESAGLRRIGGFAIGADPGLHILRAGSLVPMPKLPDPREAASFELYCANLIELAQRVFGPRGRR
jgi:thiamine monophosphate kinase